jgi:hypothetical protein
MTHPANIATTRETQLLEVSPKNLHEPLIVHDLLYQLGTLVPRCRYEVYNVEGLEESLSLVSIKLLPHKGAKKRHAFLVCALVRHILEHPTVRGARQPIGAYGERLLARCYCGMLEQAMPEGNNDRRWVLHVLSTGCGSTLRIRHFSFRFLSQRHFTH